MTNSKDGEAVQKSERTARAYEAPRLDALGRVGDASATPIGGSIGGLTQIN